MDKCTIVIASDNIVVLIASDNIVAYSKNALFKMMLFLIHFFPK